MSNVIVQFSDADESTIIVFFASPQDPDTYENLGVVDLSDQRWIDFYQSVGGENSGLPAPV